MEEKVIYSSQIEAEVADEINLVGAENRRLLLMLTTIGEWHHAQVLQMINSPSPSTLKWAARWSRRNSQGSLGYLESANDSCKENCSRYYSSRQELSEARPRISKMYIRSEGLVIAIFFFFIFIFNYLKI